MKKAFISLMAVLLVFSFVSFAAAQEKDSIGNVKTYSGDFNWVPTGLMDWNLFIPHYDISHGWWTGLVVHNMDARANQYIISFCDNKGNVYATSEDSLTGYEKQVSLLDESVTNSTSGWMVIESQYQLMGFVNFGQEFSNGTGSVTTLGPSWSIYVGP